MSELTVGAMPQTARPNFRTTALIIASAMFMEQLDATVLATALPTMARDFGVSPPHMSVALTSYLLSLAIFIPASGKMADRFGARTVFCRRHRAVHARLGPLRPGAESLPLPGRGPRPPGHRRRDDDAGRAARAAAQRRRRTTLV